MANIYEIASDYLRILQMMDDPDLDTQTLADTFEAIDGEFEIKAENYAKVMKNLEGDVEALENEIRRLMSRKKTLENNIKNMKAALQNTMEFVGKTRFKTDLFSFGIQKTIPAVVMDEQYIENIPERFLKYSEPTINKTAIKEAINAGECLDGIAHLEQKKSLRIR